MSEITKKDVKIDLKENNKEVKLVLNLYNPDGELIGGYNKLNDIFGVFNYIGLIVNDSEFSITFTYLEYYSFAFDDLNSWIEKVRKNDNIVAKYRLGNAKKYYVIKLEER